MGLGFTVGLVGNKGFLALGLSRDCVGFIWRFGFRFSRE